MTSYICGGSSFHPYECSHDNHCIHCTWDKTKDHNPKKCALCQDRGFQLVKDTYHRPIRVTDLSHRKLRILVNQAKRQQQEVLPF